MKFGMAVMAIGCMTLGRMWRWGWRSSDRLGFSTRLFEYGRARAIATHHTKPVRMFTRAV